jgi:septal ring factor EnvC (AmiA/AmiB activator)
LTLALGNPLPSLAQSRARLERQKRDNERRLKETNRILNDVSQQREATLGQLSALTNRIEGQEQLIQNTSEELGLIEQELDSKVSRTRALAGDLARLKAEYAKLVYAASKTETLDAWLFVFASESVNQFFARLNHLRFYGQERRAQAAKIEGAREQLLGEQRVLKAKLAEKRRILASYQNQKVELDRLQVNKSKLVERLAGKEERLKEELKKREEADRRLEKLIAEMIKREMRKAEENRRRAERAEAKKARKAEGKEEPEPDKEENLEVIPTSPETIRLSNSFAENKGRLGWPVNQGFISGRFGKQPHPILKGIIVENLGINVQTKSGEPVHAVAPGEVGFVASIPGVDGKIVSILHGQYVTVYSNLSSVSINPGDKVKARDRIGTVATDQDGVSEVQFQIWKGSDRLNPENWLVGRN